MQGHTGSVVCRQAEGDLTSMCFSQWRSETALEEVAERHIKLVVIRLLDSHIKSILVLLFYIVLGKEVQLTRDNSLSLHFKCCVYRESVLTKRPPPFRGYVHV